MNALKGRVSEKLSGLFAPSPGSSPPPSPSPQSSDHGNQPQARPSSQERKSLSSYFSYFVPTSRLDGLRSKKCEQDVELYQSLPAECNDEKPRWQDVSSEGLEFTLDKSKATADGHENSKKCASVCENGKSLSTKEEDEGSTSSSDLFEEATDKHCSDKPLQNLVDNSVFISPDLYEFLHSCLPNLVKGRQWVLLYSTLRHGISLRTLIRKSADLSGPCLLIVGDMQGAVFGGMLECPLKPTAKRKYQGTNQTFVFTTLYGQPRLFRPTGANRYYYICMNDSLALGGGGNFALSLDGDLLSGTSGPCETFGSLCLAHNPEFELKNVELWGFTHSSYYTTRPEVATRPARAALV
ncbi:oxidation resistance protein 1 isoform X1 [Eucalyptus grandis]|uniref:oxidation resistance protein 1 isoform X1 n=1 Tax=Eucalyptus grandis TaxID=71139 RepID=UPI00192F0DF8|nr:oxidation resistance protein 1 isoform X1 [Eucalyptus grandis]